MHAALVLEFLLDAILLGQTAFHLAKTDIVHFGRVGMRAGDRTAPQTGQAHRHGLRLVGVIGRISGDQDRAIAR